MVMASAVLAIITSQAVNGRGVGLGGNCVGVVRPKGNDYREAREEGECKGEERGTRQRKRKER